VTGRIERRLCDAFDNFRQEILSIQPSQLFAADAIRATNLVYRIFKERDEPKAETPSMGVP
jgi:hypothetical protein